MITVRKLDSFSIQVNLCFIERVKKKSQRFNTKSDKLALVLMKKISRCRIGNNPPPTPPKIEEFKGGGPNHFSSSSPDLFVASVIVTAGGIIVGLHR